MRQARLTLLLLATVLLAAVLLFVGCDTADPVHDEIGELDRRLTNVLDRHGFTGRIESTLEGRLGRRLNRQLARTGRLLFFDPVTSLAASGKNTCAARAAACPHPGAGAERPARARVRVRRGRTLIA